MKLILYSLVLLLLSACSNEEQRFVCSKKSGGSSDGLIIKNKEASLGYLSKMKFCENQGTKDIYSTDCSYKSKYTSFTFDTVTYDADTFTPNSTDNKYIFSDFTFYKCVKK